MDSEVVIAGVKFVSPSACSFGDYGGAGSVGRANIDVLLADANAVVANGYFGDFERSDDIADEVKAGANLLHIVGSYGSETVFLRADNEAWEETIAALADYPCIDDEKVSEVEMEWENDAWDNWLRSDLERAAWPEDYEPIDADGYAAMPDADKFSIYREAMERHNEYPVPEHSGIYVDVDKIAASYAALIDAKLA